MSHNSSDSPPDLPRRAPAVLVERPGEYRIVDLPVPRPGPEEVLIHVVAVNIGDDELAEHPSSGRIAALGDAVDGLRVGQPVVVEGLPDALRHYVLAPAALVRPLPDQVAVAPAALLEPAALVVTALRFADLRPGQRVLVVGAGTLARLAVQLLAAHGIDDARRAQADFVLDVADGPRSITSTLRAARPGGTVVVVGAVGESPPFERNEVVARELHLHFVLGAHSDA